MSTPRIHARTTIDGLAQIGPTRHDLMGIRFDENDGGNTPPAGETPPAAQTPPAETPPGDSTPPAAPEKVEDLPAWAQKVIADARKEAGDYRTAKNAETERVNAILAAAGIKKDEPDPVKVAQQATETANAAVRKLSVFEQATLAGADPSKLLDRASFLTSISGIDPADGPAIKAAIDAAVRADNTLKATRAVGASAVDTPGGSGEQGQITEAQLARMTPEQIVDAQSKGLLRDLLS